MISRCYCAKTNGVAHPSLFFPVHLAQESAIRKRCNLLCGLVYGGSGQGDTCLSSCASLAHKSRLSCHQTKTDKPRVHIIHWAEEPKTKKENKRRRKLLHETMFGPFQRWWQDSHSVSSRTLLHPTPTPTPLSRV